MAWYVRALALALWCVALLASASAYTVDCNHEYADCDTELGKLTNEDEETLVQSPSEQLPSIETTTSSTSTTAPTRSTPTLHDFKNDTEVTTVTPTINESAETSVKPKPRLLNLGADDIQSFANALHNQTKLTKKMTDLSDVNLDEDEDDSPRLSPNDLKNKQIPDKFYTNLQAPFHPLLNADRSEEVEMCKDNGLNYKVGERIDRGCEESCQCTPGGQFECSPRCKHPYIRRGRRLNDPLCFESPVDECCSIIACATGNGDNKPANLDVCHYGNKTYQVGSKWNVGCEQSCTCDLNSVVTCKPRCNRMPQSDKCINVQDPNDECCEVQVCDVSQDAHEEPLENLTSSTSTTTEMSKLHDFMDHTDPSLRPLVLTEPIGSIKVLQNNSVQVNLMHMNNSRDPIHLLLSDDGGKTYRDTELKYSNLILNLEGGKDYILKTKETGTKFNFTITTTNLGNEIPLQESHNDTRIGCFHDDKFYEVGEEFQIGCSELCECTGHDARECVPLICPSHVGLELVSKNCVRWAPNPPPQPPNCCPRIARCLSDGTCHYKGVDIPNWSEVPTALTGCEERCFCENGELDCQEACNPLPAVPPQTLRCPLMHKPAHVNISDEDCCKEWGCVPHAGNTNGTSVKTFAIPTQTQRNYVTPISPAPPNFNSFVLPTPSMTTESISLFKHHSPIKMNFPKYLNSLNSGSNKKSNHSKPKNAESSKLKSNYNITVFTPHDFDKPFKVIQAESSSEDSDEKWNNIGKVPKLSNIFHNQKPIASNNLHKSNNFKFQVSPPVSQTLLDNKIQQSFHHPLSNYNHVTKSNSLSPHDIFLKQMHDSPVKKVPLSQVNSLRFFIPVYDKKSTFNTPSKLRQENTNIKPKIATKSYFEPTLIKNKSDYYLSHVMLNSQDESSHSDYGRHNIYAKYATPLKNKEKKVEGLTEPKPSISHTNIHLLTKEPNPYETVLQRVLPTDNVKETTLTPFTKAFPKVAIRSHSTIDLENLLSNMELESEANKNLGRSAGKNNRNATAAGQSHYPLNPSHSKLPPFLPTIPPDHNNYPQEDIPDYDQNNIHHPNPIEPALAGLPPGLSIPSYGDENKKLTVLSLQSDSPTSIKMLFGLPSVLVGLRGSVDLRYTDTTDEDITHWYSQVFAPADEVLTTPRLEFRLTGLKPSTKYKVRGKLYLHNLPVEPESEILSVRTQDLPTVAPEEKRKEIDCKLIVVNVNDTTALVSWRHFSEEELQLIDGIQVRYRAMGTPIFSMTELLHHSRSTAELRELRPGSQYEASLVLIPPPRANTELYDSGKVEFTTAPSIDPYNWTVVVEARTVGSEAAELAWRGVPVPAERWVRVYRAAHACGPTRKEHDAFRLAARDAPTVITLTGLESNARCRVWLELFLTNGKVKTSNVLEIHTKSLDSPQPIDNVIEASPVASRGGPRGDYYGALVVVGVVAALAALAAVLLLLVLVRRHRPHSVPITSVPSAPRESSLPPYDNPAYKLELQQETMDL